MKSLLFPALAGALCLPATYRLSRDGDFPVAVLAIVVIGTAGAAIAMATSGAKGSKGLISLGLAFVLGAFSSEIVAFVWYYLDYGYKDRGSCRASGVLAVYCQVGVGDTRVTPSPSALSGGRHGLPDRRPDG